MEVNSNINLKEILNNNLNPLERKIIIARYGLDDGEMKTIKELSNIFQI